MPLAQPPPQYNSLPCLRPSRLVLLPFFSQEVLAVTMDGALKPSLVMVSWLAQDQVQGMRDLAVQTQVLQATNDLAQGLVHQAQCLVAAEVLDPRATVLLDTEVLATEALRAAEHLIIPSTHLRSIHRNLFLHPQEQELLVQSCCRQVSDTRTHLTQDLEQDIRIQACLLGWDCSPPIHSAPVVRTPFSPLAPDQTHLESFSSGSSPLE